MKQPEISDIRLGWLQRFCSLARHRNLKRAGKECGVDPTVVSDSIQRLEDALCRLLVAPATSFLPVSGRAFVPHAEKILQLARLSPRSAANVSIGWFMALIAVSEHENYVKAGLSLGWTRHKVMRGVSELQSWIGCPLVYSGDKIRLTSKGEEVVRSAREVIATLGKLCGSPEQWWRGRMKRRKVPWWVRTYFPEVI